MEIFEKEELYRLFYHTSIAIDKHTYSVTCQPHPQRSHSLSQKDARESSSNSSVVSSNFSTKIKKAAKITSENLYHFLFLLFP